MSHKTNFVFFFIISTFFLQSCRSKQDELFTKFQNEFQESIQKSNAKKFEYQYDGLSPQSSYFVDCKIKYITLKSSGELTDIEELIIFEKDSISKIITRKEIYEGNDNGNEAGRNWSKIESDSIFISDFVKKKKEIYVNNKLAKTLKTTFKNETNEYIYRVKKQTESNYNCR